MVTIARHLLFSALVGLTLGLGLRPRSSRRAPRPLLRRRRPPWLGRTRPRRRPPRRSSSGRSRAGSDSVAIGATHRRFYLPSFH